MSPTWTKSSAGPLGPPSILRATSSAMSFDGSSGRRFRSGGNPATSVLRRPELRIGIALHKAPRAIGTDPDLPPLAVADAVRRGLRVVVGVDPVQRRRVGVLELARS